MKALDDPAMMHAYAQMTATQAVLVWFTKHIGREAHPSVIARETGQRINVMWYTIQKLITWGVPIVQLEGRGAYMMVGYDEENDEVS